ncbi:MAG TPA: peptide deformylase [Anaerolineaceae bacterium]|nr:peptide deformylase [Anaerolineaceae bacterium]HOR83298.1 peptide deformylase [Anaerolineaceae bacterium]HPL43632.1 peptide deformylase [Anaerolineaceae bacterium]HPY32918.1 peptide deformylase [Anaerolineaceae bacterium]HQC20891.1 peptide deformylase [Anaerolineaceae bacterium]
MAVREIVKYPAPLLRLKAKPVQVFDKTLQTLIDDMFETMRDAPGVGLAAPQIGESLRVVVVEYTDDEREDARPKKYVLVNPEIVRESEETVTDLEGCLSVPGLAGEVERFEAVTVQAKNRFGKPIKLKASGWLARIFQHEIDHLNGVLYIDRATRVFQPTPEEMEQIKD